ncbi:MAG: hypothetical protein K2H22_02275 [Muribaculaceae bacterium]|nr:hypothetical protein [Muribaculaceae bacterium]
MKAEKAYVVSFGASDRYSVPFDGSLEEFERSDDYRRIKDAVYDYVKSKFPTADLRYVAAPQIEPLDDRDEVLPVLDRDHLDQLKHEVERQVEVKMADHTLDSDAPYSDVG